MNINDVRKSALDKKLLNIIGIKGIAKCKEDYTFRCLLPKQGQGVIEVRILTGNLIEYKIEKFYINIALDEKKALRTLIDEYDFDRHFKIINIQFI